MSTKSLILSYVFICLPLFAHADTIEISVAKDVEIPKVNAKVVIDDGAVVESNCDSLTQENQEGITYTLKQEKLNFSCVPTPSTRKVKRIVSIDAGGTITMSEVISTLAKAGKAYEVKEGLSKGYFSNLETATPSCQINNDGTVNFSSCVCNSELQAFDIGLKTCAADPTVLSFYAYNCSEESTKITRALKIVGASVFPPPSVSFGMCSVELYHYRAVPHDLIFKILYFSYQTSGFRKAVKAEENEAIKMVITQNEIDEAAAWAQEWSKSSEAQNYPEEIRQQAENLSNTFKYDLNELIEIIQK